MLFSVLAVSFWVLQVVKHDKFQEMADNNHQRTLRCGRREACSSTATGECWSRTATRSASRSSANRPRTSIALLGCSPRCSALKRRVRDIVERHRREPSYRPITIVQDASLAQVAAVTARRLGSELPDMVVQQVPTRQYPETLAAHLFGYVGEVSDTQVARDAGLKSGDIIGQSGVEKIYNAMLMGEDGAKRVVVNSTGREMRTLEESQPSEGKRLQLTIDYDVQRAIEDGFDATGSTARRSCSIRVTATCSGSPAAGVRSECLLLGNRPRHLGGADH